MDYIDATIKMEIKEDGNLRLLSGLVTLMLLI